MSPLWKRTARALMLQGRPRCRWCGAPLCERTLTIDHWVPRSRGGNHELSNLVPCCRGCNEQKADRTPGEFWRALCRGEAVLGVRPMPRPRRKPARRRRGMAVTAEEVWAMRRIGATG